MLSSEHGRVQPSRFYQRGRHLGVLRVRGRTQDRILPKHDMQEIPAVGCSPWGGKRGLQFADSSGKGRQRSYCTAAGCTNRDNFSMEVHTVVSVNAVADLTERVSTVVSCDAARGTS